MKVLVVDDDDGIRLLCARALTLAGHECTACPDGAAALRALSEGDWDLVLTDLSMPGAADGLEVLRRARACTTADVVLMTGYPDVDSAVSALKAGAYDYLTKPFGSERLIALAGKVDERRRLHGELARERAMRAELNAAYTRLRELESLRGTFGRFVTPEVARFIMADPDLVARQGERREVTVLFADVRGFTSFASREPPERVVACLNALLGVVIDAVHAQGGIVNKFLGDGLMAVFGAPVPMVDHAGAAARCALRAGQAIDALGEAGAGLRMGFGINTGEVVAGCIGSAERVEYTVIGHAVNLAQRLEAQAGPGRVLVGERTRQLLAGGSVFSARMLGVQGLDRLVPVAEMKEHGGGGEVAAVTDG